MASLVFVLTKAARRLSLSGPFSSQHDLRASLYGLLHAGVGECLECVSRKCKANISKQRYFIFDYMQEQDGK